MIDARWKMPDVILDYLFSFFEPACPKHLERRAIGARDRERQSAGPVQRYFPDNTIGRRVRRAFGRYTRTRTGCARLDASGETAIGRVEIGNARRIANTPQNDSRPCDSNERDAVDERDVVEEIVVAEMTPIPVIK